MSRAESRTSPSSAETRPDDTASAAEGQSDDTVKAAGCTSDSATGLTETADCNSDTGGGGGSKTGLGSGPTLRPREPAGDSPDSETPGEVRPGTGNSQGPHGP